MFLTSRNVQPSNKRRRAATAFGVAFTSAVLLVSQQPAASALDLGLPKVPGLNQVAESSNGESQSSADLNRWINDQLPTFGTVSRDAAWQLRNTLRAQAQALPPQMREQTTIAIDSTVEAFFPGLIAQRTQPAPKPHEVDPVVPDNNPCPAYADACVDLDKQESWLQHDGKVTYGPVPISSGRAGYETPRGPHVVNRKVKDEVSHEFNDAPMPNTVYFTNDGIGFHEGDPNIASHGCIHLRHDDSLKYFDTLQSGDVVYVF